MSRSMSVAGSAFGTLMLLFSCVPAQANGWHAANPCACATPVAQPCYQTVPVTEYRQVRQVVRKPVYETKYVNQKVTMYKPVTETRTVDVPTLRYENVTECRTVYRNCGYWQTRYQHVNLPSPCEYDPRPDVFGWLNRTAYSIRATFTPRVIARRQYVPRTVAQQIPVTRTIAHRGTRKVTYNVTRMVPYTTTRKVAVNTVRYVTQEVVRNQPVTVWRRVPIGSTIAYSAPTTVSQTVLAPTPDPVSSAKAPNKDRTANSEDSKFRRGSGNNNGNNGNGNSERDSTGSDTDKPNGYGIRRSHNSTKFSNKPRLAGKFVRPTRLPSVARAGRWQSRSKRLAGSADRSRSGPSLITPNMSVARSADH